MAYMNQTKKAAIAAALKPVMPKGWKYSLRCGSSGITLTISEAPVDLIAEINRVRAKLPRHADALAKDYVQVNPYWLQHQFDTHLGVFQAIDKAMNTGNWDRSDVQTDYFDVGHYVYIHLGRWDKPFRLTQV